MENIEYVIHIDVVIQIDLFSLPLFCTDEHCNCTCFDWSYGIIKFKSDGNGSCKKLKQKETVTDIWLNFKYHHPKASMTLFDQCQIFDHFWQLNFDQGVHGKQKYLSLPKNEYGQTEPNNLPKFICQKWSNIWRLSKECNSTLTNRTIRSSHIFYEDNVLS